MDELAGAATLGVVNVGTHGGRARVNDRDDRRVGCSGKRGRQEAVESSHVGMIDEAKFGAGEMLLRKLESVAEARSIEVSRCVGKVPSQTVETLC